jgi:hypothetical protein
MRTISGTEIRFTSNQKNRTFTIRCKSGKYRTNKMNIDEFQLHEYYTANDWKNYLLKSNDYYAVK